MKLIDYIKKESKEALYAFYTRIIKDPKRYDKITKIAMVNNIIDEYKKNPEIILSLCSIEEINILKNFINENNHENNNYIEYLLYKNLTNNYLLNKNNNKYEIPSDILNYIKMAINLLNEEELSYIDVMDYAILGLIRIYNIISVETLKVLLTEYNISFKINIKEYIKNNPKLNYLIGTTKIKNTEYIYSKEYPYYKDISHR